MTKIFELISEVIASISIALSPILIALGIAAAIYFSNPSPFRLGVAITIAILGVFSGIYFAIKIFKSKDGAVHFISRVSASPELDELKPAREKTDESEENTSK